MGCWCHLRAMGVASHSHSRPALREKSTRQTFGNARVEYTLCFMYAPHEHAQRPCHRDLSLACPGLVSVADIKGDVCAARGLNNCVPRGSLKALGRSGNLRACPTSIGCASRIASSLST
jgi:hypothetical protein